MVIAINAVAIVPSGASVLLNSLIEYLSSRYAEAEIFVFTSVDLTMPTRNSAVVKVSRRYRGLRRLFLGFFPE